LGSPFILNEFFNRENLHIIPITDLQLIDLEGYGKLNHGFNDIPFFPSWREFYQRSVGKILQYPDYMAFVLILKNNSPPIGVLAVQLMDYNHIKSKVRVVVPKINLYLYLSWIALDVQFQSLNYFTILFDFYQVLIRKLRNQYQTRIEGAAIVIRRMRPVLWRFLNCGQECPQTTEKSIIQDTKRFSFTFQPSELFDPALIPTQDHVLMLFKSRK
jgi:hypothetical protein